jgi:hypothetical protein
VALCFAVAGTMTGSIILSALLGGVDRCDEVPNAEAAVETKSAVRMPLTKGLPIAAWLQIFPVEARGSKPPVAPNLATKAKTGSPTELQSVPIVRVPAGPTASSWSGLSSLCVC